MAHRLEDLRLDEGYWRTLLEEAERLPIAPTREGQPRGAEPLELHEAESAFAAPQGGERAWEELREAVERGEQVEVEVIGTNRGGLVVSYNGVRGFVPASHLSALDGDFDEEARRAILASYVGRRLRLRVIELDPKDQHLVCSERAPVSEGTAAEAVPQILYEIRPGEIRRGVVTNLTGFGAFVDLGGYEGLVHVSEISWSRVEHPRDVLRVGQEVNVYVMGVQPEEKRIALSLKRAKPNPWEGLEQRYRVGQIVRGVVTNVVQFGAFVKVEEDLEGLVHVSELAEGDIAHPRNVVREGEVVLARVIAVDGAARRLALSLRGVAQSTQST
ncbi:MAG: S1 RNA-binding domain-containing protein [Thermoflexales bacterium]|nr:S1 RNA-binding domain-containing protein [Thermoflexales bacterium]MDW8292481.1 S1 RNA-binding domain-containing protein [Anaerolineae bacterium]